MIETYTTKDRLNRALPVRVPAESQSPSTSNTSAAVPSFIVAFVSIGNAATPRAHGRRRRRRPLLLRCSCWEAAEVRKPTLLDEGISDKKEPNGAA